MNYYINEINDMLFAAYAHGGDSGGPYGCAEGWCKKAIENFLKRTKLDNDYEYISIDRVNGNNKYFRVPQIVAKIPPDSKYSW